VCSFRLLPEKLYQAERRQNRKYSTGRVSTGARAEAEEEQRERKVVADNAREQEPSAGRKRSRRKESIKETGEEHSLSGSERG